MASERTRHTFGWSSDPSSLDSRPGYEIRTPSLGPSCLRPMRKYRSDTVSTVRPIWSLDLHPRGLVGLFLRLRCRSTTSRWGHEGYAAAKDELPEAGHEALPLPVLYDPTSHTLESVIMLGSPPLPPAGGSRKPDPGPWNYGEEWRRLTVRSASAAFRQRGRWRWPQRSYRRLDSELSHRMLLAAPVRVATGSRSAYERMVVAGHATKLGPTTSSFRTTRLT